MIVRRNVRSLDGGERKALVGAFLALKKDGR